MFSESLMYAQTEISGVINSYSAVTSVNGDDAVSVSDPGIFAPGDTVLIIQMKGMGITLDESEEGINWGKKQFFNNAGNYEFMIVDQINDNNVKFTRDLVSSYNADQTVQLVKTRGYKNATVSGKLTAGKWDGEKGGVIALIVSNKLTMEADIDATSTGFSGGGVTDLDEYECSSENPGAYSPFHFPQGSQKSGKKGEGPVTYYWSGDQQYPIGNNFVHGKGRLSSAGGGGNGHLSGGGGGSNFGQGGLGGFEFESCEADESMRGAPGERMDDFFTDEYIGSRFFMAGGGGGSTSYNGKNATAGGNAGGMVIIIADNISGNGHRIISDGGSVSDTATAGAGGGGGGGTIITAVDNFNNSLTVQSRGGKGGDVIHEMRSGPGGGGGGGTVLTIHPFPGNVTTNLGGGRSGRYFEPGSEPSKDAYGSTDGNSGGEFADLEITLNGFLFNGIKYDQVICEEQVPGLLEGTQPKGGTPHPVEGYYYEWFMKSESSDEWEIIPGEQEKDYQPPALTETTSFIRVVKDNDPDQVIDSSNVVEITVQPKILGNLISEEQTICEENTPAPLTGEEPLQGGTGIYNYNWEEKNDDSQWSEAVEDNTGIHYQPGPLGDTTTYRRIVTSGKCADTSQVLTINVHPLITGNIISPEQTVCEGTAPDELHSAATTGGGTGTYDYLWEQSQDLSDWSNATEPNNMESLPLDVIAQTTYYRRVVNSGMCADISGYLEVSVLPAITENVIGDHQTICFDTPPEEFQGSTPEGGDEPDYRYNWENSTDLENWHPAGDNNEEVNLQYTSLTDPTYFRRIVKSGPDNACIDTSNTVHVDFHPFSGVHIEESADTVCSGSETALSFNFFGEGPWEIEFTDGTQTETIKDISDHSLEATAQPETTEQSEAIEYIILSLTDSHGCEAREEDMTGTATVTVYGYPTPDAGADGEACGPSHDLNSIPSFGEGFWSSVNTEAEYSPDSSHYNATATITEYGTHRFVWRETNWQCTASDETEVTFYRKPSAADAGEDQSLQFDFQTFLEATPPETGAGSWELVSGGGAIVNENDPSTQVTNLELGENIFRWSVINGVCPAETDQVSINVSDLDAPTGFSPNNSGLNDYFVIRGLENSQTNKLVVFNRQGNEVYREVNYQNDWDGRNHQGTPLPNDTYYYILEVDNKHEYKGFIIIRR